MIEKIARIENGNLQMRNLQNCVHLSIFIHTKVTLIIVSTMSRCWKTQNIRFVLHKYQAIKCKSTKKLINNSTSQVEIENKKSKLQAHLTLAKS